jgi:mono/diheme cytochrome c family protein
MTMAPSRMFDRLSLLAMGWLVTSVAMSGEQAGPLGVGRPLSAHDLAAKDIHVMSDGAGLPEGRGTARQGALIYAARCAACHGDRGQGLGDFPALVGGRGSLATETPLLTVGSYWPYATTIFDYIRRAMPYQSAGELSADEVYALTAWILAANGIVKHEAVMDRKSLPKVRMPNQEGFERAKL